MFSSRTGKALECLAGWAVVLFPLLACVLHALPARRRPTINCSYIKHTEFSSAPTQTQQTEWGRAGKVTYRDRGGGNNVRKI